MRSGCDQLRHADMARGECRVSCNEEVIEGQDGMSRQQGQAVRPAKLTVESHQRCTDLAE